MAVNTIVVVPPAGKVATPDTVPDTLNSVTAGNEMSLVVSAETGTAMGSV